MSSFPVVLLQALASPAWKAAEDFEAGMQRLVSKLGPSAEEVAAARAGIEALAGAPARCPCGHRLDSDRACLNGRIYGPCGTPGCDGPCTDTHGYCNADICACPKEDE